MIAQLILKMGASLWLLATFSIVLATVGGDALHGDVIVFQAAMRQGGHSLYVLDVATHNIANISNQAENDTDATWSPDGRSLAYVTRFQNRDHLAVMGFPHRQVRILSAASLQANMYTLEPAWSSDGRRVVFVGGISTGTPRTDLYTLDMRTDDLRQTTQDEPDGQHYVEIIRRRLGYSSERDAQAYLDYSQTEVFLSIEKAGSYTFSSMADYVNASFSWSPDGSRLALIAVHNRQSFLHIIADSQAEIIPLPTYILRPQNPEWRP